MLSNTIASHGRAASARDSARLIEAETPRCALTDELEHRTVPEHGLVLASAQYEPRLPRAGRSPPLDAPAAVHPEVAAEDEPTLEMQEEVLPHRLYLLEPPAVEPLGQALHRGARMRRLDFHPLAHENLQPAGRPMQRIAFRHRRKPTIQT